MRSKIFESEAELGQNFFVRNALATVEGGAGSGDLTASSSETGSSSRGHWRDCEPPDQSSLRADEGRRKSGWEPDARSDRGPAVFRSTHLGSIVFASAPVKSLSACHSSVQMRFRPLQNRSKSVSRGSRASTFRFGAARGAARACRLTRVSARSRIPFRIA
jgi:hypothetical protein